MNRNGFLTDAWPRHDGEAGSRLGRTLLGASLFSGGLPSRAIKVHLGQTPQRDYTIRMREPFIPRHVSTPVIRTKDGSTLSPGVSSE
jgi:hypothetical protein